MKIFSAILVTFFLSGTTFCQTLVLTDFEKLSWLEGTWSQTNIKKPGRTSTEQWTKSGQFEMIGRATTLQNGDTVFVEKATLLVRDNVIYYVADVPQNKQPVYFKLTSLSNSGFVCENPDHDFPKKISYQYDGVTLKAQISGDGKATEYTFQKKG